MPFIVRWPTAVKSGSAVAQTVCLTDVMATCAALTGAELPNDAAEDSYDLSQVIMGTSEKPARPYTLHQTWSLDLAIRKGDWKYLDHKGSGGNNYKRWPDLDKYSLPEKAPKAPGQLYNLSEDPGETTNLYFQKPEMVKELKGLLEEAKTSGRSAPLRNK